MKTQIFNGFLFLLFATMAAAQTHKGQLFRFEQQREAGGLFGQAMAGLEADINGDGYFDVLASSATLVAGAEKSYNGRVYVVSGRNGKQLRVILPPKGRVSDKFGCSTGSLLDDLNRDGKMDFWVGDADSIYVYSGLNGDRLQGISAPNGEDKSKWGLSVISLKDLDGDTCADLAIQTAKGIYAYNIRKAEMLYHTPLQAAQDRPNYANLRRMGDLTGDGASEWLTGREAMAYVGNGATGKVLYQVQSPQQKSKDGFGRVVAALHDDMNDDDINDFAVAAPLMTMGSQTEVGVVHVFSGKDGKLLYSIVPHNPAPKAQFGSFVEPVYDRNGDCINDWLISHSAASSVYSVAIYSGKDGVWIEDIELPAANNSTNAALQSVVSAGGDIDRNNSEDILFNVSYLEARPNEMVAFSPETYYPPLQISPADSIKLEYNSEEPLILAATRHEQFKKYQWFWNGEEIPGATSSVLEVGAGGTYTVRVPIPCIETLEASVEVPVPPSDTPVMVLLGRVQQVDKEIIVHNRQIEVRVWDDKREDGDYISLNFNGKWVLKNHLLSWNQKVVPLTIEEGLENIFCMYALNQGSIPPNTAAISIKDGSESHFFVIRSDFRRSGTVRIVYKPK